MKKTHIIEIIKDTGLSENEAIVYSSALFLGPSTILDLSKESNLPRTTVYGLVTQLKHAGMMFVEIKGLKKLYTATHPEKLRELLSVRKNNFEKQFPELEALYNLKGSGSLIKYYEGLNAVKGVYEDLLNDVQPNDEYLVLSDQEQWQSLDEEYFKDFLERRAKLPIKIKMLLQDTPTARHSLKYQKNYNCEVRILPAHIKLSTNLIIIPQRVVIHQLISPVFATTIENPSIIKMHKESFSIMWESGRTQ